MTRQEILEEIKRLEEALETHLEMFPSAHSVMSQITELSIRAKIRELYELL